MPTNLRNSTNVARVAYPGVYDGSQKKREINFMLLNKLNVGNTKRRTECAYVDKQKLQQNIRSNAYQGGNNKPVKLCSTKKVTGNLNSTKPTTFITNQVIFSHNTTNKLTQPADLHKISTKMSLSSVKNLQQQQDFILTRKLPCRSSSNLHDDSEKFAYMNLAKNSQQPQSCYSRSTMSQISSAAAKEAKSIRSSCAAETLKPAMAKLKTKSVNCAELLDLTSDSSCSSSKERQAVKPTVCLLNSTADSSCSLSEDLPVKTKKIQTEEIADEDFLFNALRNCATVHLKKALDVIVQLELYPPKPCTIHAHAVQSCDNAKEESDCESGEEKETETLKNSSEEETLLKQDSFQVDKPPSATDEHMQEQAAAYTEEDLEEIRVKHREALKKLNYFNSKYSNVKNEKADEKPIAEIDCEPLSETNYLSVLSDCMRERRVIYKELSRLKNCFPTASTAKNMFKRQAELELQMKKLNQKIKFYSKLMNAKQ